ncbi:uncharacterized protein PV09_01680 [Verruconis gallopava]|uniref:Cytochrome c oxidase assembly factor 3 n=1 Tax=Verruconis gallopava TaxID=253628 RepID=A0A0D1XY56_9PEZI|nr:uncharacterized protein PV09_01680 [Verruconis gallopava]KIW07751.1 hypothetical protein PV09_01680 [Verruconis gallopava]
MPLLPKSSYYDGHYRQGASLIRARQPFLVKNIATGAALFAFTIAVYTYTLKAVGVDEFEDVKPARPPQSSQSNTEQSQQRS